MLALLKVSIHAPTRGATRGGVATQTEGTVSIHAPTRGATIDDRLKLGE